MFASILPANSDPQEYLAAFRSTSAFVPGFRSSDIDTLLSSLVTEADPGARDATVLSTETTIAGVLPAIPVTQGVRVVFSRSVISGVALADSLPLDLARLRR